MFWISNQIVRFLCGAFYCWVQLEGISPKGGPFVIHIILLNRWLTHKAFFLPSSPQLSALSHACSGHQDRAQSFRTGRDLRGHWVWALARMEIPLQFPQPEVTQTLLITCHNRVCETWWKFKSKLFPSTSLGLRPQTSSITSLTFSSLIKQTFRNKVSTSWSKAHKMPHIDPGLQRCSINRTILDCWGL